MTFKIHKLVVILQTISMHGCVCRFKELQIQSEDRLRDLTATLREFGPESQHFLSGQCPTLLILIVTGQPQYSQKVNNVAFYIISILDQKLNQNLQLYQKGIQLTILTKACNIWVYHQMKLGLRSGFYQYEIHIKILLLQWDGYIKIICPWRFFYCIFMIKFR